MAHFSSGAHKFPNLQLLLRTPMKKSLLAAAALLATVAVTDSKAQGVRFGLKGGANLSNLSGDFDDEDRLRQQSWLPRRAMLNIGLLDDGFLSLQPEVLYSQKGYSYDEQLCVWPAQDTRAMSPTITSMCRCC